MSKKPFPEVELTLDRIIGGGQTIGTLEDGKKCLVWGSLPGEKVKVQITKKKSSFVEGVVIEVITPSPERIKPRDPDSYLSTSPWQIMDFAAEEHYKAALIEEAFELHDIVLPQPITVWSDRVEYGYRNKVEFSFWYDTERETLDLAFFRRGTHGKITVQGTSLASDAINQTGQTVLRALRQLQIDGRTLKTLLIRSNRGREVAWQLYVKDEDFDATTFLDTVNLTDVICAEVIYSNPKSPASVITERLASTSSDSLSDTILDVPFTYATEGFFQINLPVYERALRDMQEWVICSTPLPSSQIAEQSARRSLDAGPVSESTPPFETSEMLSKAGVAPLTATRVDISPLSSRSNAPEGDTKSKEQPEKVLTEAVTFPARNGISEESMRKGDHLSVVDLYSGVGTIGLTIGGDGVTLVESNEHAVREMRQNIEKLGRSGAKAVLAPSEKALEYITADSIVIVDPPRAGLHEDVITRLLETTPARIIYLSCNPVTQARDVARLAEKYGIRHHQGYNFFPRTPHIEHLVVLDAYQ